MWHLTAILAILIISSHMLSTSEEIEDSDHCLEPWSACGLLSNLCCYRRKTVNGSSAMIKFHCDYLEKRIYVKADEVYRYKDVLVIEKLKDDEDFPMLYDEYVQCLAKIEERINLKRFMDRMYESEIPARTFRHGRN
uniref:Uncharacterized protein n=1 Tax=Glyptapanteles flavicoxis TaxID=463051 RepID=B7S8C6_9HYME|nr:conserved hypothetical protein [Glyptapanteles flavicoxis]